MFLISRATTVLVACYQAMNHRVWISTNRRSKVGVIIKSKSEVTDVMRSILRFHHRTECNRLNHLLFTFALYLIHQLVQCPSSSSLRACRLEFITELGCKFTQVLELLWVRIVMNTIRKGLCFLAFLHDSDAFCYCLISQEHKLFNQLVGIL